MGTVARVLAVVVGGGVSAIVLLSAVRTVVLPRSEVVALTRAVFLGLRKLFDMVAREQRSYEDRDRVMALFGPFGLMALAAVWALAIVGAFTLVFWGLGVDPLRQAFVSSGSSFTTLGFAPPHSLPTAIASVAEAVLGLGLVALLISYLPSIYAAFQRREVLVSLLETRAGNPPTAVNILVRHHRIGMLDKAQDLFATWEVWFADIEESHTSQGALPFFRSPLPHRSWITAGGAVLDAAALSLSVVDIPRQPEPALCLRAGYLSLRHIADFFSVPYDGDPAPDDPITIAREEFDDACREMEEAGVPLKADRDQAWADFRGWRVNYDTVLVTLAGFFMAPYARWSSDRSSRYRVQSRRVTQVAGAVRRSASRLPFGRRD
ncbi:MAG: hypothetical protein JWN46_2215 [Acidimicrobiales bacterium]|nr:hypothetical protein [Acidimicrobiales bacterium]